MASWPAQSLRVQVGTYNFNLQDTSTPFPDLQSWLVPTLSESRREYNATSLTQGREAPDIYAVGFQELLPLHLAFAETQQAHDVRYHTEREIRRAVRHHAAITRPDGLYPPGGGPEDYTLIGEVHLVGISLYVLGRNRSGIPERVKEIRASTASTGFFNLLGNKGAVALRIVLDSPKHEKFQPDTLPKAAEDEVVTLLCAHLTAHDHNVPRRNQDFETIVRRLAFPPSSALALPTIAASKPAKIDLAAGTNTESLQEQYKASQAGQSAAAASAAGGVRPGKSSGRASALDEKTYGLYDCHHAFFFGDLNYRIALDKKGGGLTKEDVRRKIKQGDHTFLLKHDQLQQEARKGNTLHGFVEHPLGEAAFGPTYKFKPQRGDKGQSEEASGKAADKKEEAGASGHASRPQELSPKRVPGWTDRILWLSSNSLEQGEKKTTTVAAGSKGAEDRVQVELYRSIMGYTLSDHKPVTLLASLPRPSPQLASRLAPFQLSPSHATYRNVGWLMDRIVGYAWCGLVALGAGKVLVGLSEVVVVALISVWWLQSGGQGGDLGYWFTNWASRGPA